MTPLDRLVHLVHPGTRETTWCGVPSGNVRAVREATNREHEEKLVTCPACMSESNRGYARARANVHFAWEGRATPWCQGTETWDPPPGTGVSTDPGPVTCLPCRVAARLHALGTANPALGAGATGTLVHAPAAPGGPPSLRSQAACGAGTGLTWGLVSWVLGPGEVACFACILRRPQLFLDHLAPPPPGKPSPSSSPRNAGVDRKTQVQACLATAQLAGRLAETLARFPSPEPLVQGWVALVQGWVDQAETPGDRAARQALADDLRGDGVTFLRDRVAQARARAEDRLLALHLPLSPF